MEDRIPAVLQNFISQCRKDAIGAFAAQAAYFFMMSSLPLLLVFTAFVQYSPVSKSYALDLLYHAMPEYVRPLLEQIFSEVYFKSVGLVSLTALVALWAAGKALQYVTAGLNVIHGIKETRNWLVIRLWSMAYTVIFVFALMMLLYFMVFAENVQLWLSGHSIGAESTILQEPLPREILLFFLLASVFASFFTLLPNEKVRLVSQLPGAVLCAFIWLFFSFLLSLYRNFFSGFSFYGSMSTVVLLMFWLYGCMYTLFLCAEWNVFLQREKRRHNQ